MTERELEIALAELDRILNDPDVRMDPDRVWALADRLSSPRPSAEGCGEAPPR
jgi:hypothetical protein